MSTTPRPPSVNAVLRSPALVAVRERYPAAALREAARAAVAALREQGGERTPEALAEVAAGRLELERPPLRRVLNATGVLLHTNLGRAPLSEAALEAVRRAGQGATDLELSLAEGGRGDRQAWVAGRLRLLCGGTMADGSALGVLVVNNNAAAVLLALAALARGREVIVSRGEQVEIGGSFRLPDVVRQSGARLVEVGTTNRTRVEDYEQACGPRTGAILRVHPSNYRVQGFVARPALADLAEVARAHDVPLLDDIGSGLLADSGGPAQPWRRAGEPVLQEDLAAGADLVCFSGDKLLGGPQCGLMVGRAALISRCARHPLARAVRADKLSLAALQATLDSHLARRAEEELPVWRMLAARPADLRARVHGWKESVASACAGAGADCQVVASTDAVGGGALPGMELAGWALRLSWPGRAGKRDGGRAQGLAAALRRLNPAVLGRVEERALWLHARSVSPDDDGALMQALSAALGT